MERIFKSIFAVVFILFTNSWVFAGGIDTKTNLSSDYIRTLNRNAATDAADAVVYNPAGVMKLEKGLYVKLDGQYTLIKEATNTVGGMEYESDITDFIPSLFALYKRDKWAAFAAFTIPAGGGSVEFEQGSATTLSIGQELIAEANLVQAGMGVPQQFWYDTIKSQRLEGKSVYYGFTLGGAYAVNDVLSVSLGVRYIEAEKEAKGSVTISAPPNPLGITDQTAVLDYEQSDEGWGGVVGVNISPTKEFNIGLRYESKVNFDLEYKINRDDLGLYTPDAKEERDLPGVFGLGVAYNFMRNLRVEGNFTYYMNENADWSDPRFLNVDDGFDLGIALEYIFTPRLRGSLGYLYTDTGLEPDNMLPEWPELNAHSLAAGVVYEPISGLNLSFGLTKVFYRDETTSTGVKLEKDGLVGAVGIQYKFK